MRSAGAPPARPATAVSGVGACDKAMCGSSWLGRTGSSIRDDNVVRTSLSRRLFWLYDQLPLTTERRTTLSGELPPAGRRPTMVDVAALAGVGLKTVSRVVNGEPGVSPALEARVRRAIEQLNYRRDANASMLRR